MAFKKGWDGKQELSFLPLDSIEAKVASVVKLSKMYLTGSKKITRNKLIQFSETTNSRMMSNRSKTLNKELKKSSFKSKIVKLSSTGTGRPILNSIAFEIKH